MINQITQLETRVAELERRLRNGRRWSATVVIIVGSVALMAFHRPAQDDVQKGRFTEIDAERINIIEPDGRLGLVLANQGRLPDVIIDGVEHDTGRKGSRGPGMLFFNHKGDESGGLTYSTRETEGGAYRASAGMSFDQYGTDQVVTISYADNNGVRRSGLTVVDRPVHPNISEILQMQRAIAEARGDERERLSREMREAQRQGRFGAPRVFLGSDDGSAMLRLQDTFGRDRVMIVVDSDNVARLEFLDENGNTLLRLPESE